MGTPYNLLFPRHETSRLSAPIAETSDTKWQDKSYQRDKIKLTQMLLIEMEWSQLQSSFPFIFSILHKNTTLTAPIAADFVFKDRDFYLSGAKVVCNSDRLRHSKKLFGFLRNLNFKEIPVILSIRRIPIHFIFFGQIQFLRKFCFPVIMISYISVR